jgi:hypothetical protein
MKHATRIAALLLLGHIAATPALAGIADTPLPVLEVGKKTYHLYSVPGAVDGGNLSTFFVCTSTDTAPETVAVETFGGLGGDPYNDAAAESYSVLPGATGRFGTQQPVNDVLGGVGVNSTVSFPGPGTASARILSTSKKLVCTAFVGDRINVPPQTSWQLTIIKKKTQKGD